jgi:hypothetical protein
LTLVASADSVAKRLNRAGWAVTIAIALQVHDGAVLASDSAMTLTDPSKTGPESVLNVYNNANKIFNLRKGLPIGAVIYGMGSIGSSSISTLIKDLRKRFASEDPKHKDWALNPNKYTIAEVAKRTREFIFDEHFKPLGVSAAGVQFGMTVAGYSAGAQLSEVWTFEIRDGKCAAPNIAIPQGQSGWYAGGDPDFFCRVANGYSQKLEASLLKAGIPQAGMAAIMATIGPEMAETLVEAPMPIQDAVELAEFFVNGTTMFTKFKRGAATVGGPVESAAITKHEGFKWVNRKHYFDESLNPRASR